MKKLRKTACALLAAGLTALSLCACSSKTTDSDKTDASQETNVSLTDLTRDWQTRQAAGVEMKLPADMEDFSTVNDVYLSASEDATVFVAVSKRSARDGAETTDVDEDLVKDSILDGYDDVEFIDFDNQAKVDSTDAVYFLASMKDGTTPYVMAAYLLFIEDDQSQMVEYLAEDTGDQTKLMQQLEAWQTTLKIEKTASDSQEAASKGDTSASSASTRYVVENDYFYVQVPDSWAYVISQTWSSADGAELYMSLHEPTSFEALEKGGTLVTFMLLPEDEDYTYLPDYDFLGTMNIDGSAYNVIASYPTDAGFTEKTKDAYVEWKQQVKDVVASLSAMDGYTFQAGSAKTDSQSNPETDKPALSTASSNRVSTPYFTVTIPDAWVNNVVVQSGDRSGGGYTLKFIEPSSQNAGAGGVLGTIMMIPAEDDFSNIPETEWLGMIFNDRKSFNLLWLTPTDLQYTPATQKTYQSWQNNMESVAWSVEGNSDWKYSITGR